jgi:hypothetical protein
LPLFAYYRYFTTMALPSMDVRLSLQIAAASLALTSGAIILARAHPLQPAAVLTSNVAARPAPPTPLLRG